MAGITVTLSHPGSNNIYTTRASNVSFSASASLPSKSESETQKIEYSNLSYSWTFEPSGGSTSDSSRTFTGLTIGSANTLTAKATATCTKTVSTKTEDPETGESSWSSSSSTYTIGTDSDSITVYTRPGLFTDYNFTENTIIQSSAGLTAQKVENWCKHCGKYLSWKQQQNNYNIALTSTYKRNSGDIITAEWYNDCGIICGLIDNNNSNDVNRVSNDQSKNNSLITAEVIKKLGTAISKE